MKRRSPRSIAVPVSRSQRSKCSGLDQEPWISTRSGSGSSSIHTTPGVPPAGRPLLVTRAVVDAENAHRHDSTELAAAIMSICQERGIVRRSRTVARSA